MAKITHFDQGDTWTPQATFTVGGTPTDPTTLIVRVKNPDGTVAVTTENTPATPTLPIVRVSAGVFKHNGITLNDAGYWHVRFEGTGAAAAAEDHQAIVDPSEFYEAAQLGTRSLVGLAETKDWLQQQNIDTSSDLELSRVIVDVSDRFHAEADREFKVTGTNPQTRTFAIEPLGRRRSWYIDGDYVGTFNQPRIKVGDLTSFTAVSILDTDWTTVLETPSITLVTGHPLIRQSWEPIRELEFHSDISSISAGRRLTVTGAWGFPAVPGTVRQAVLDAVAAIMDRDVEHYRQDAGFSPVQGGAQGATVVMVGAGRQRLLSLPPSTLAVAWSFRDHNIG